MPRPPQIPQRKKTTPKVAKKQTEVDKAAQLFQQGFALHQQGKLSEAKVVYEAVLNINPQHFDALNMYGTAQAQLGNFEIAVDSISRAISINPRNASCYNNRGNALMKLKQPEAALASFDQAIQLEPDYADAFYNRGVVLQDLKQPEAAVASYDIAIQLKPDYADAHSNRGSALLELKQPEAALVSFKIAFDLNPELEYLHGTVLHAQMHLGDWWNFEDSVNDISSKINNNQKVSASFIAITLTDALATHYQAASIWSKDKHPINPALGPIFKPSSKDKIRIGYYSADFYKHATAALIAELFERHDKSKFEVIGFSFGPAVQDAMRQRLEAAFSQFIDVRLQSDRDVAQLSRTMGIDIAIDLKGYTTDSRPEVFSYRAAPIQISYLGYPGTMAAEYIDYLIADPTLVPVESQKYYSEKIIYLPDSYQVNDRHRAIADTVYSRDALGLPSEGFVFCCFNNNYKITPPTFDGWMRILHAVPGSVLWLLEDNPTAAINLRKEAQARGIDPQRLVFAKRMGLPEHLARHRAADLFIDTLPCNAHTTASDALWAGLPVLTCMGESFASRVAGSLLNAIGMPELVSTTQADYEALASDLALNPAKLAALKAKLEKNRLTTPLFDTPRFTKHLEAAYAQVYQRYRDDLPPEHVYVDRVEAEVEATERSDKAEKLFQQGFTLHQQGKLSEAYSLYEKVLSFNKLHFNALNMYGAVQAQLGDFEAAVDSISRAIEINANHASSYSNRGEALFQLKRLDAALVSFKIAFDLNPELEYLHGTVLHAQMHLGDWWNFEDSVNDISSKINSNQKVSAIFIALTLTDALATHYQAASIWSKDKHPINPALGPIFKPSSKDKIRIGYYSADFYKHATAALIAELFERHDKSKFEIIGFSFGPPAQDAMRQRLEAAFNQFIDVRLQSDKDVAQLSRTMGIDIAIDLKGYTADSRPGIFSYRAAPIQISYLGYPGTMAAEYIDYLIADPTLVPVESQKYYSEKIIYLPDSYQVNDRHRAIADTVYSRDALGLPSEGFVFCCFNNNYKITPPTFDGWMRILHAVPGSVLWLLEDNPTAAINLRKEAQARGIDPQRLVFAKRMGLPEHLARHRAADLFIDTLPCNAHTTASDALWAGLPVLTCMGESFASRVAGSLLNAIGMPELVSTTQADYEALASDLALNPAKLAALKAKLEKNRLTTPLFDTPRFTKHLEAAYTQVYQRYRDDLPPEHVYVGRFGTTVDTVENTGEIEALFQQGFALHQQGKLSEASSVYEKVLSINSKHFHALNMAGALEAQLGNFEAAISYISCAIDINPNRASSYYNRGEALRKLKQAEAAIASYEQAIQLKPDHADAYFKRGNVLLELKQAEAALASYEQAIQLQPDYAEAYSNRGNAQRELKQLGAALASFDKAIQLKPDYSDAYNNRGNALIELKQLEAALASFNKAIQLKPDYSDAYNNRGNALIELKQPGAALASYEAAFNLMPASDYLLGKILHTKMYLCDWRSFEDGVNDLSEKLKNNLAVSTSFPTLGLTDSLATHHQVAFIWSKDKHPINSALGSLLKSALKDKIRIGYYSADFYNHATAYLMAELFERHDKSKFEVIGFSFGPSVQDAMRQRLEAAFSQFIDVRLQSDKDVAQLSRNMGIDIAVDLKGHTGDARPGIFSYRAAPIQISYLGYPGTMAAEYIDYLIADSTLVPVESQKHYSEKIIYLPDSYQVNDRQRVIADTVYSRETLGLPHEGFVFCSFNNNYKITPPTFDGWMRILHAVPGSVLWLLEDNATAAINLRKEAQARGIDSQRLVFAKRMDLPEHLARHRAADLFIDTLPCNAHTTASDALWAGLPLLTCMGESFASRVAGSLLNAVGLSELVTTTQADYEALAIDLALNPAKIAALKAKLEENRLTTPLFDTPRFTKHLEAAYAQVYQRYRDDLPPEHVYVKSGTELMKYSIVQDDEKKEVQHNSMPERVMYACCPLCESANIGELTIGDCSKHPLYNPKINPKMHWKKCSDCLHVFTNGFFTEEICEIVFGNSHQNQVVGNQIEQSRAVSARMIEKVLPFASEGVWLDVGFGNASLLFTAQEFGFTPVGIDLRKENVHALRALNVESHCVDLSELKLNEACSVISMADVLEHMPFPKDGLVSANKLLANGGVLLVSMPNTENIVWSSLTASNSNPYWGELEHYHNFSRTRLYQLLDEHGFKVMRYGISERYRVCMEVVAVKVRDIHQNLVGSGKY